MDPKAYLPRVLEAEYLAAHRNLTPAARELLRAEIAQHPDRYVLTDRARALVRYAGAHRQLLAGLDRIIDLPDEEFNARRLRLFAQVGAELATALKIDPGCLEAKLLRLLIAETDADTCLHDALLLEQEALEALHGRYPRFDERAPHFWRAEQGEKGEQGADAGAAADEKGTATTGAAAAGAHAAVGANAAQADAAVPAATPEEAAWLTATAPEMIAWLHTLESISQLAMSTARYRAAIRYAETVMRAAGYPHRSEGTLLLAYARLEDEDAFFSTAREANQLLPEHGPQEDSPWFLLGRALLFYKLGKDRAARRAIKDFAARAEGGAFFLTAPVYHVPYLPVRPEPREPWELTHQAIYEADSVIVDTPDFVQWAEGFEEVRTAADRFADTYGFE